MKILSPLDVTHEITLIPRFYPVGDISLELYNEDTSESDTLTITPLITDGYLYLTFDFTFINNTNYRLTMLDEDEAICYRGKLFITDQTDLENYKVTKDIFTL